VAVWFWILLNRLVVSVQVVLPFQSSAVLRGPVVFAPPATRTCPLAKMPVASRVAVCAVRTATMFPPETHVADVPEAGMVKTNVLCNAVPLDDPPVTKTFPFASRVSV
jgi:hypothetical protein